FGSAGYPQWSPSGISLTDANNDGVYEVSLNLAEGAYYEFKYINGNDWPYSENVPGGCNTSGNRSVTVGTTNLSLPARCFGSCSNCVFAVANDGFAVAPLAPTSGTAYPAGTCYNSTLVGATVS